MDGTVSRFCPHCKSPARGNPCWYYLDNPQAAAGGWDAPCTGDDADETYWARERRIRRIWLPLVLLAVVAAAAFLIMKGP
jgi:hypothetical protein